MASFKYVIPSLLIAACVRTVVMAPVNTVASPSDEARLYNDDGGGIQDSVRMVVRDDVSWERMWRLATRIQEPAPARPSIDFTRQMVIVVAAGRMRPGDRIRVDSTGVRNDRFVIVVQKVISCPPIEAPSYPLEIVSVTRSDLPTQFTEPSPIQGPSCNNR